jgi:hypothetical protein
MKEERSNLNLPNHPIVISPGDYNLMLKQENPGDLIAVYCHYYFTGRWQKTNQPWATDVYIRKGLKFSENRVRRARKKLEELGLIEIIEKRDKKGRIKGKYIKIKHIWSTRKINNQEKTVYQVSQKPEAGKSRAGKRRTNTLSEINRNSLKNKNKSTSLGSAGEFNCKSLMKTKGKQKNKYSTQAQKEYFEAKELKEYYEKKQYSAPLMPERIKIKQNGREIDLNIQAGKRLICKFEKIENVKKIMNVFLKERSKSIKAGNGKYTPNGAITVCQFEKNVDKILDWIDRKGINWYTGEKVAIDETSKGPKKLTFQEILEKQEKEKN